MIYLALCLAIITQATPATKLEAFRQDIQTTAIFCELLDVREQKYMFAKVADFEFDLNTVRARWRDLYDAPHLHESYLLPERVIAGELVQLNRMQKSHCEQVRGLYPHDLRLMKRIEYLEERYRVWDYVRDARCEFYYVHIRRQALKKLLLVVGEEAFSRGELPFAVLMGGE
jgi:hypothetical protein